MSFLHKTNDELIDIAKKTTKLNEMLFLVTYPSMNVRRALARNRNIDDKILKKLLFDPVENVSYMASKHPKAKLQREFKNLRVCVLCEKDEKGLNCVGCPKLKPYSES